MMTEEVSKAIFVVIATVACLILEYLIWKRFTEIVLEDDSAIFPLTVGYGTVLIVGAVGLLVLLIELTTKAGPLLLREALR